MAAIQIDHLTFTYPRAEQPALRDVSLSIPAGELLLLCGPSGGGKTTLLRHLKTVLTPHGTRVGAVSLDGVPLAEIPAAAQAGRIGFVLQQPDDQIVTDKVWHELAFGLENLGTDPETMRLRVGEMASFFGIQTWFDRETDTLSGGQKQLLNLASVLVMQPEVLVLDEPTAQLDPIAAAEFLRAAERASRELGVTVILSEQRLEQALAIADRAAVLEQGALTALGAPQDVARALHRQSSSFFAAMPTPVRLWGGLGARGECPLDVRAARRMLQQSPPRFTAFPKPETKPESPVLLEMKDVWFRYEKTAPDVLRGMSLTVRGGEILAVVGGNGSGKSTALRLLSGLSRPYRGRVRSGARVLALPQDARTLFSRESIRRELEGFAQAQTLIERFDLSSILDRDPGDLSGGEVQRAAIALLLAHAPDVLLLDEPTKGMDAVFRRQLGALLRDLAAGGLSIVLVSHDVAFCAEFADRAGLLFDGQLLAAGAARDFFTGNHFYTTAANRIARPWLPGALLCEEVIAACQSAQEPFSQPD